MKIETLQAPFIHLGGYAYACQLDQHSGTADDEQSPRRSQLMLYENGLPVGFGHQQLEHIRSFGSGRYSHWQSQLIFSTTDGTDPNTNGRQYTFCPDSFH